MKIGFLYTKDEFTERMLRETRDALPNDKLIPWERGQAAPADDLEVLLMMGKLDREQMQGLPTLKLIQTLSAGYEGIDEDAATEMGIWLSYAPSPLTGNAASVAEFTIFLMMAAARRVKEAVRAIHDHTIEIPHGGALLGKTVLIVGLGGIGEMLASRLQPFGMTLSAVEDHAKDVPDGMKIYPTAELKPALGSANFVVLCLRADKTNENLFDAAMLRAMKPGAILINVARGSLIDEEALFTAIKNGQIAAAGLDVLKTKPADASHPLLTLEQVFVTPHIAGMTDVMLRGTVQYVAKAIEAFHQGRKMHSYVNTPKEPRMSLAAAN